MLGAYYLGQLYLGESGLPAGAALIVQKANISVTTDALTLVQHFTLVTNDAAISLTADNIPLNIPLLLNDATISLTTDSLTLTQQHTISVNDSTISVTSDGVTLFQAHVLAMNDALLALSSDNIFVDVTLSPMGATITLSAENPTLIQHFTLAVSDAGISLLADNTEVVKFQPEIDPLSGLTTVVPKPPGIDKPTVIIGIDKLADNPAVHSTEGKSSVSLLIDKSALAGILALHNAVSLEKDLPAIDLRKEIIAVHTDAPKEDGTRPFPVTTTLMEDVTALMEDPGVYMGGTVVKGKPDFIADLTLDIPRMTTHNEVKSKGLVHGISH